MNVQPYLFFDGRCEQAMEFYQKSLGARVEFLTRFNALAEGGQVQMPLGESFFAKSFGMVADRFGVSWMVIAGQKKPA